MESKRYHLLAVEDLDDLIKANEEASNPNSKFDVVLSDAYVAAYKTVRVLLLNSPELRNVLVDCENHIHGSNDQTEGWVDEFLTSLTTK